MNDLWDKIAWTFLILAGVPVGSLFCWALLLQNADVGSWTLLPILFGFGILGMWAYDRVWER